MQTQRAHVIFYNRDSGETLSGVLNEQEINAYLEEIQHDFVAHQVALLLQGNLDEAYPGWGLSLVEVKDEILEGKEKICVSYFDPGGANDRFDCRAKIEEILFQLPRAGTSLSSEKRDGITVYSTGLYLPQNTLRVFHARTPYLLQFAPLIQEGTDLSDESIHSDQHPNPCGFYTFEMTLDEVYVQERFDEAYYEIEKGSHPFRLEGAEFLAEVLESGDYSPSLLRELKQLHLQDLRFPNLF